MADKATELREILINSDTHFELDQINTALKIFNQWLEEQDAMKHAEEFGKFKPLRLED